MSGAIQTFVICDRCGKNFPTTRVTMRGARGDAERKGWRVSHMAGARHPDARTPLWDLMAVAKWSRERPRRNRKDQT